MEGYGKSYDACAEQAGARFEKGREYALGTYFGLSPGGDLVFGVEQGGEILWKAASERHADGDIMKSIDINQKRFEIPRELAQIFKNTALDMFG